jgi:hypothetical protein
MVAAQWTGEKTLSKTAIFGRFAPPFVVCCPPDRVHFSLHLCSIKTRFEVANVEANRDDTRSQALPVTRQKAKGARFRRTAGYD